MHSKSLPTLSSKGKGMVKRLKASQEFEFHGTFYDPEENPQGVISLWYSENSLMTAEIIKYMNTHFHLLPEHLMYRWRLSHGTIPSTFQALPEFFNAYFEPLIPVKRNHCVHGNSLSSVFAQFVAAVCNPGDGVLMSSPYYGTVFV
ncbi:1-aminocyclopropane-1-carboxylate synthase, and related proteins [Rhizoctonia solani AG-1 IB]|uniref:Aminotransferase class I/classII domain-containing protein n=2 Tax=Rhizoctonia solani TaxID=456999 RepID=A0A8H2WGF7_9AGAM|nr:unnamed protein product [Rhizoctonia solani]CCO37712.1 1-aminocyclopropane-1-carboxylate synthase, and related proteins [Rhizoctonia solani AG-1 IB]